MPQPGNPGWAGIAEATACSSDDIDTLPDVFGSDLAQLFDYCRALLGQDADAARTARSVLDSALPPQPDPDRRRARFFALGRRQALALRPVKCASGMTPTMSKVTVPMPTQTYQSTNGGTWYPSGDQSSLLVYQGSISVPNLCNGARVSFQNGGTFSATIG